MRRALVESTPPSSRFGGASSTGLRDAELKNDRFTVSGQGQEGMPTVYGAPGVDRECYPVAIQVADIHTLETEDIKATERSPFCSLSVALLT